MPPFRVTGEHYATAERNCRAADDGGLEPREPREAEKTPLIRGLACDGTNEGQ